MDAHRNNQRRFPRDELNRLHFAPRGGCRPDQITHLVNCLNLGLKDVNMGMGDEFAFPTINKGKGDQAKEGASGCNPKEGPTYAHGHAKRCGGPDTGGTGKPLDFCADSEDGSCTQEADTRQDLRCDASLVMGGERAADFTKQNDTDHHEHVCPDARWTPVHLALVAYRRSDSSPETQFDQDIGDLPPCACVEETIENLHG